MCRKMYTASFKSQVSVGLENWIVLLQHHKKLYILQEYDFLLSTLCVFIIKRKVTRAMSKETNIVVIFWILFL